MTWRWVIHVRIVFFRWTNPLKFSLYFFLYYWRTKHLFLSFFYRKFLKCKIFTDFNFWYLLSPIVHNKTKSPQHNGYKPQHNENSTMHRKTSHNTAKLAQHSKVSRISCVVEILLCVLRYHHTKQLLTPHVHMYPTCILVEIQQNVQQHVEYFTEIQTFKLHGIKKEVHVKCSVAMKLWPESDTSVIWKSLTMPRASRTSLL